jgi:ribosomal protein L13E
MIWRSVWPWFRGHDQIVTLPKSITGRQVGVAEGFSLLELERAGLSERDAEALGLKIDRTRRSGLGSNVVQLDTFINHKR